MNWQKEKILIKVSVTNKGVTSNCNENMLRQLDVPTKEQIKACITGVLKCLS